MKRVDFAGILRVDLRRAFGLTFYFCIFLVAAIHIRSVWLEFSYATDISVVSMYNEAVSVENYMQTLIPILVSAVYSAAFIQDMHSGFYRFQLMRCNRAQYLCAKLIACALSAFLSAWLGIALFLLAMGTRLPLVLPQDVLAFQDGAYFLNACALLQSGHPLRYLLTAATLRSIAMVFWPFCAMTVSAYVPNRFVVLGAPWLVQYAIGMLDALRQVPYGQRFSEFSTGDAGIAEPSAALLQMLIRYLPLAALCVILFCVRAGRRLRNG